MMLSQSHHTSPKDAINTSSTKNARNPSKDQTSPKFCRSHSEPILQVNENYKKTCTNRSGYNKKSSLPCCSKIYVEKRLIKQDIESSNPHELSPIMTRDLQILATNRTTTTTNSDNILPKATPTTTWTDAGPQTLAKQQLMSGNSSSCTDNAASNDARKKHVGCAHYKRRAMFVTPCCNKFYKCRFCHDENESHHFDRKTLNELICSECNTRQKVQEACINCGIRFGKYTCLICNLFDDADKKQYHCDACGICRIGGAENFFHCKVCNMCLPIQLKIDGHKCVENISRSHCPVCLGDIHTSRIPCHIPDCGHLLHKMCFDQLLASGHYACPTCQTSLIDMTALWEFLDAQAARTPMPKKFENETVHIFCNDCQRTSKTYFHFIGLKCMQCGAYNTTQDVKRRVSLVADETNTA